MKIVDEQDGDVSGEDSDDESRFLAHGQRDGNVRNRGAGLFFL